MQGEFKQYLFRPFKSPPPKKDFLTKGLKLCFISDYRNMVNLSLAEKEKLEYFFASIINERAEKDECSNPCMQTR